MFHHFYDFYVFAFFRFAAETPDMDCLPMMHRRRPDFRFAPIKSMDAAFSAVYLANNRTLLCWPHRLVSTVLWLRLAWWPFVQNSFQVDPSSVRISAVLYRVDEFGNSPKSRRPSPCHSRVYLVPGQVLQKLFNCVYSNVEQSHRQCSTSELQRPFLVGHRKL